MLRAGEAAAAVTAASLAIRLLPFRWLVVLMGRADPRGTSTAVDPAHVRVAVRRASRRLPWRTLCFQEGLATHWMLRRRGLASRLHYGIRQQADALSAHVWVEVGGMPVIGAEEPATAHSPVAVYPAVAGRFP
ncbi:lasso peptide biosynthesis B2 protein [Sphingomonas sp. BN140010]|uniref:Lasso peptide biosynthesis B2 protein n=1 Tax=Sphingomonas arvum TaxID=2992113 RepID=A0ABT3JEQ3_9SPHN|nr:lasso peptide biosynthesis B2 protein [Sphingomonas sp. BN140010]MCW3797521.1 lasso peptide biosynthesis B2 protein [Sphingomonas sp. BN140010]